MIKENVVSKDLKGREINQPKKQGKSVEIDGNKRFCGHRFLLKQQLYGDKRCIYCGKWFHWSQEDGHKWIKAQNIDNMNVDSVLEPLHCGNSHCEDYHVRYLRHQEKLAVDSERIREHRTMQLFKHAKRMGYV